MASPSAVHDTEREASRSLIDIVRLATAVLVSTLVFAVLNIAPDGVEGAEADLLNLTADLPDLLTGTLVRIVQLVSIASIVVVLIVIAGRRQWRRLGTVVVAMAVGAIATRYAVSGLLDVDVNFDIERDLERGAPFPSVPVMASFSAAAAANGPWMSRRWRRGINVALVLLISMRLLSGTSGLRELVIALVVGWTVGVATTVLFATPDPRPDPAALKSALDRFGVQVGYVAPVTTIRGRHYYETTTLDGQPLSVVALSRDGWQASLPQRIYRSIRYREGDDPPFASIRELAEHEALLAVRAKEQGVPVPRLRAMGTVLGRTHMLAFDVPDGTRLIDLDDISDNTLTAVWEAVRSLRDAHIIHRGLNEEHLYLCEDETVQLTSFRSADITGDRWLLATDVAEVLMWSAARVGEDKAVALAVEGVGVESVRRALPRLQPLAMSPTTRERTDDDLHHRVTDQIQQQTGAHDVELTPLQRINPRSLVMLALGLLAINALLPQLAGAGNLVDSVRSASLAWMGLAFVASALSYFGAAASLMGAVAAPLRLWRTMVTQLAGSFAAIATPASVAGIAVNARYLTVSGVDSPAAAGAVTLDATAGFIVHVIITIAFIGWGGPQILDNVELPGVTTVAIVVGTIAAVIALVLAVPASRQWVKTTAIPQIAAGARSVAEVATMPLRLAQLLGGSAMVSLSYLVCFVASVAAFGETNDLAGIALVYLVGNIVAVAAPTPGGLGAAEAAYIGGLTATGVPADVAVPAVLLFRVATFWLPILPGWVAMWWLQRRKLI